MVMVTTFPDMKFRIEEVAGRMPERIRWELVEGELHMMTPAGPEHGLVAYRVSRILDRWVYPRRLGELFAAETGFLIHRNPDTLLAPDVPFVRADRLDRARGAYFDGPPDLAVEVISPSESKQDAMDKARQWLDGGTQAVWLVWPRERQVTVFTKVAEPIQLSDRDILRGEPVLPGFQCNVREIFE
jgi:Uma2 family endonuclease